MTSLLKTLTYVGVVCHIPQVMAFNPQPAWYAGLIVGANYQNNVEFNYYDQAGILQPGQLGHDIMGSIGGQIGYRWCDNFRFEIEGIYNNSPYSYLRLGDVTIHSPDTSTGLRLSGQSQSGVGTFNFLIDLFGDYSSKAVPYVGVGVGFAYIVNDVEFYYNDVLLSDTIQASDKVPDSIKQSLPDSIPSKTTTGAVGQAIVGVSYYLDDYSYFALDGRYLVSQKQTIVTPQTSRFASSSFNVQYQLYSLNIVFNSAFDCA